ncbi:MAG: hypothetical protein WAQ24_03610 [Candidatus Saccharimonadales bacterium]
MNPEARDRQFRNDALWVGSFALPACVAGQSADALGINLTPPEVFQTFAENPDTRFLIGATAIYGVLAVFSYVKMMYHLSRID